MDALNFTQFLEQNPYLAQAYSILGEDYSKLIVYTIGITVYALVIWKFYRSISKRDVFKLDLSKYEWYGDSKWKKVRKAWDVFLYVLKYGIIFPVYIFVWFSILALFIFLLSKTTPIEHILFISIAVVSATRITSYYKEELASDIAKLLPLVLLGTFIVDPNFFSLNLLYQRIAEVSRLGPNLLTFLAFSVVLEWFLRIAYLIKQAVQKRE